MEEAILEIIKYTIPALVVFATAYFMIKSFMEKEYKLRQIELKYAHHKESLPIRLHAYERLSLFLERISFNNLIPRVRESKMTAQELHYTIIQNIKMEYEHNLAQQVYVSSDLWNMVTLCKDEMIKMINLISTSVPKEASAAELSKAIFDYLIESEQALPTQKALDALKDEIREVY